MEWQFWFAFGGLLWVGFICRVGMFLEFFALGALIGLFCALLGLDLEFQLSAFLLISAIAMIVRRRISGLFSFDKSFRDRL